MKFSFLFECQLSITVTGTTFPARHLKVFRFLSRLFFSRPLKEVFKLLERFWPVTLHLNSCNALHNESILILFLLYMFKKVHKLPFDANNWTKMEKIFHLYIVCLYLFTICLAKPTKSKSWQPTDFFVLYYSSE